MNRSTSAYIAEGAFTDMMEKEKRMEIMAAII
jgi:hypothetical protein